MSLDARAPIAQQPTTVRLFSFLGITLLIRSFYTLSSPFAFCMCLIASYAFFAPPFQAGNATKYAMRATYIEIYNDRLFDLLDPSNDSLQIREGQCLQTAPFIVVPSILCTIVHTNMYWSVVGLLCLPALFAFVHPTTFHPSNLADGQTNNSTQQKCPSLVCQTKYHIHNSFKTYRLSMPAMPARLIFSALSLSIFCLSTRFPCALLLCLHQT